MICKNGFQFSFIDFAVCNIRSAFGVSWKIRKKNNNNKYTRLWLFIPKV